MKREEPLHIPLGFDDALRMIAHAPTKPPSEVQIVTGDCTKKLKDVAANSVHFILTDPPYFLDGLDNDWKKGQNGSLRATGSVGGLPVGMKFDPKQGKALQKFMEPVCRELMRVLVPGGFFVCFSQPRLYHRMALAAEEAGFEIRDLLAWHFTKKAQFKAFSMNHFVEKMPISPREKKRIVQDMDGRKTAQLRPQFEAMLLAQKPRNGSTLVENWQAWRAGLMDASKTLNGSAPATVMQVEKPLKEEYAEHLTVKPVRLLKHLIELFTCPGQMVLDPFLGSGSTAVAAKQTGRDCIGIEINPDYVTIAERRLGEVEGNESATEADGADRRVQPVRGRPRRSV